MGEISRIRGLVDCAMTNDPRLKRKREEEVKRKQDEKDKRRQAALDKQNQEEAEREETRKNEEAKKKAEQERLEQEKKELKAQKKSLKDMCKSFDNFCLEDTDIDTKSWWLEGIDLLCANMNVDDLRDLNTHLKTCSNSKKKSQKLIESEINKQTEKVEGKKKDEL